MAINTEMFKRIAKVIEENPEQHDQHEYEHVDATCGTTRCIAGWAIHLWGLDNGHTGHLHDIRREYVKVHPELGDPDYPRGGVRTVALMVGEHILGLNDSQSVNLFYNMNNSDALRMVKEYASGRSDVRRED